MADLTAFLEPALYLLHVGGIAVFAVSGALAAARRRLDVVSAFFFAVITAIGGGTLRDLLIDAPVFWIHDATALVVCLSVTLAVWLVPLRAWPSRAIEWFDAAGLAAFAVYGASKALGVGISPLPAVVAGVVTACVGGILRDVVANVPSIMLRNELYVTAAILAAGVFVLLEVAGFGTEFAALTGALAGFALRGAAIRWGLAVPTHRG